MIIETSGKYIKIEKKNEKFYYHSKPGVLFSNLTEDCKPMPKSVNKTNTKYRIFLTDFNEKN